MMKKSKKITEPTSTEYQQWKHSNLAIISLMGTITFLGVLGWAMIPGEYKSIPLIFAFISFILTLVFGREYRKNKKIFCSRQSDER